MRFWPRRAPAPAKRPPSPPELMPTELVYPPAPMVSDTGRTPVRHTDPGAAGAFKPKPVARSILPRLEVQRPAYACPAGYVAEIERQNEQGEFVACETRPGPCVIQVPPAETWRIVGRRVRPT